MKTRFPLLRILLLLSALSSQLSTPPLYAQKAVQKSDVPATRDEITGDLKFGTGKTATFLTGSTLTLSGALAGTPTGGTLNLSALTLTLPATVSGGTSSFQPLDSDLTAIAALATTSYGRSFLPLADAAAGRTLLGLATIASSGSATDLATGTLPNARLVAVPNSALGNSTITIAGTSTALGGTITLDTIDNGLASNGLIARTAANTRAARTITGTAGQVTVTNGDGVSGNPTLSLPSALTGINSATAATGQALTLTGGDTGASLVLGALSASNASMALQPKGSSGVVDFYNSAGANEPIFHFGSTANTADTAYGRLTASNYGILNGAASSLAEISFRSSPSHGYRGVIAFATNGSDATAGRATEKARITESGNLLIGTTTDISGSGGLKVAGAAYIGGEVWQQQTGTARLIANNTSTIDGTNRYAQLILGVGGATFGGANDRSFYFENQQTTSLHQLNLTYWNGSTATQWLNLNGTTGSVVLPSVVTATNTTSGAVQIGSNIGLSGNAGGASYFGGAVNAATFRSTANSLTTIIGNEPGAGTFINGTAAGDLAILNGGPIAISTNNGTNRMVQMSGAGLGSFNFSIYGTTSASTSLLGAFVVGNGTAATSVGIGGGNINAGGTITGASLATTQTPGASVATASTHKVAIVLNGVTYYMLLTNVP